MHGNRRITPWMLASVPIVFILAASNLPTAPSSSCAISPSPIPATPNTLVSPCSPATVTKRSPDANPRPPNPSRVASPPEFPTPRPARAFTRRACPPSQTRRRVSERTREWLRLLRHRYRRPHSRSPQVQQSLPQGHSRTNLLKQTHARDRSSFAGRFPTSLSSPSHSYSSPAKITAHCPEQTPCASIRFVRRADQGILRFSFASLRGTQRTGHALFLSQ